MPANTSAVRLEGRALKFAPNNLMTGQKMPEIIGLAIIRLAIIRLANFIHGAAAIDSYLCDVSF